MNQNIIAYLNENKEKYSKEALIAELKKAGYAEGEITESIAQVFDGAAPKPAPAKTSFWNFKDKKVYTSAGQKRADFLFGVFAPMVISRILNIFIFLTGPMFIGIVMLVLWAAVLWYLFNHRRLMFYGMIVWPIIFIVGLVLLMITL